MVFNYNSSLFTAISYSPLHLIWHGEAAVSLFFLLSGFVLTLPFIKNKYRLNLISFYIKRIFRIYPAFILAIIFSILLKLFFFHPTQMVIFSEWINEFWKWHFNDISISEIFNTFVLVGHPFNNKLFVPIIGTLRTEMLMSIVLPFYIFIALRLKFILNIAIVIFLFLMSKNISGIFYLGIFIAIYKDTILVYLNKINSSLISCIILIIASIFYTSRYSMTNIIPTYNKVSFILSIIGCACFLIFSIKIGFLNHLLKTNLIQFLGKISYSLYLYHFPILLVTCSFASSYLKNSSITIIFLISITFSLLISWLITKYIENTFMKLGRKLATRISV